MFVWLVLSGLVGSAFANKAAFHAALDLQHVTIDFAVERDKDDESHMASTSIKDEDIDAAEVWRRRDHWSSLREVYREEENHGRVDWFYIDADEEVWFQFGVSFSILVSIYVDFNLKFNFNVLRKTCVHFCV